MLRYGHVHVPNLLKHGSILKAAADTRGSSLFDGGATHIVHEDDKGAIPGSWQPDVAGLRLGDDTFIPAFGSVLKDFIPPPDVGGPDIRRRVLIAPAVASRVWSGTQEVRRADNGVEHEIEWLDKRWTQNDWVNLASSVRIWRLPASSPPLAPSPAPAPPATPQAAPPVARATRSSARTAALNRARAVQPRALIFDSGASNGTFVKTLKAKGWLIDVVTDSSTPRDVTVRSGAPKSQNVHKKANMAPAKKVASVARAARMKRARRRVRLDAMAKHLEAMLGTGCGLSEERSTSKERTRTSRAVHCSAEC